MAASSWDFLGSGFSPISRRRFRQRWYWHSVVASLTAWKSLFAATIWGSDSSWNQAGRTCFRSCFQIFLAGMEKLIQSLKWWTANLLQHHLSEICWINLPNFAEGFLCDFDVDKKLLLHGLWTDNSPWCYWSCIFPFHSNFTHKFKNKQFEWKFYTTRFKFVVQMKWFDGVWNQIIWVSIDSKIIFYYFFFALDNQFQKFKHFQLPSF